MGLEIPPPNRTNQRAARAQGISTDTAEAIPCVLHGQVEKQSC